MSISIPIEALRTTPRLNKLYHGLVQVELEHPGMVLVADSPFFVHQDGSPYYGTLECPRYVPKRKFKRGSSLKQELEIIALGISQGAYPEELTAIFEKWALLQLRLLRNSRRSVDRKTIKHLKKNNLLN